MFKIIKTLNIPLVITEKYFNEKLNMYRYKDRTDSKNY